jgi:hypothetical protein
VRHAFSFPQHIREALKNHIEKAVSEVDMKRFGQEAPYTDALAAKLQGIVYDQNDGYVKIESTSVNDRGRGAAEKWSGADLIITASISDRNQEIRKAIMVQSKLGNIDELRPSQKTELRHQVRKMRQFTNSVKVMEIPVENGQRRPKIVSGQKILAGQHYKSYELSNYFVSRILTTFDGDTHRDFVDKVQDSGLTKLKLIARVGLKQSVTNYVKPKASKEPVLVKVLA